MTTSALVLDIFPAAVTLHRDFFVPFSKQSNIDDEQLFTKRRLHAALQHRGHGIRLAIHGRERWPHREPGAGFESSVACSFGVDGLHIGVRRRDSPGEERARPPKQTTYMHTMRHLRATIVHSIILY